MVAGPEDNTRKNKKTKKSTEVALLHSPSNLCSDDEMKQIRGFVWDFFLHARNFVTDNLTLDKVLFKEVLQSIVSGSPYTWTGYKKVGAFF